MNEAKDIASTKSILLVDDSAQARSLVTRMLEGVGYRVIQAANARAGVSLLEDRMPDLVITDIFMPEGDGFEMMNEIRRRELPMPIIVMSGGGPSPGPDFLSIADHLGAMFVLQKPFRARELLDVVAKAISAGNDASKLPPGRT